VVDLIVGCLVDVVAVECAKYFHAHALTSKLIRSLRLRIIFFSILTDYPLWPVPYQN
jgi:hypothetical protein